MGRPHRQDPEGGWHHVFNRGIRKTPIFLDDDHRSTFLRLVAESAEDHAVELHGFCLVGNHYHLLVRCPFGGISGLMHDAVGEYARWFNWRHEIDGPLCRGRFGSRLLKTDESVVVVSAYVHQNSLDIAPKTPISEYRWSSASQYLVDPPASPRFPVHTKQVLSMAGGASEYWRYVEMSSKALREIEQSEIAQLAEDRLDEIDAQVALRYTCSAEQVRKGSRIAEAKYAALLVATQDPALSRDVIAQHYGYSGRHSLNSTVNKLRSQLQSEMQSVVETVSRALVAEQ